MTRLLDAWSVLSSRPNSPLRKQPFLLRRRAMASQDVAQLYKELKRVFEARLSDQNKCGALLSQLKVTAIPPPTLILTMFQVALIERGLLPVLASTEPNLEDLVVVRMSCAYPLADISLIKHELKVTSSKRVHFGVYVQRTSLLSTDTFLNCRHSTPTSGAPNVLIKFV